MPSNDHCCVPLCTNRRKKDNSLSFHAFPRNADRRMEWIVAIRRDVGPAFRITQNTVVCSAHFLPKDFWPNEGLPVSGDGRRISCRRLKSNAVPSVFSFRRMPCVRPSPQDRANAREKRKETASLPVFGPMDEKEYYRALLNEKEEKIKKLQEELASAREEVAQLRRQTLCFTNLVQSGPEGKERLRYYTNKKKKAQFASCPEQTLRRGYIHQKRNHVLGSAIFGIPA